MLWISFPHLLTSNIAFFLVKWLFDSCLKTFGGNSNVWISPKRSVWKPMFEVQTFSNAKNSNVFKRLNKYAKFSIIFWKNWFYNDFEPLANSSCDGLDSYYHSQWLLTCKLNQFKPFSTKSVHLQPWLKMDWFGSKWFNVGRNVLTMVEMVCSRWISIDLVENQSHRKYFIFTRKFNRISQFWTKSIHLQPWLKMVWCWLKTVWFGSRLTDLVYVNSHWEW